MAPEDVRDPSATESAATGMRRVYDPDSLMRIGSRLHEYPLAWKAAAFGLRALSQPRRAGQIRRYLESNDVRRLRLGAGRHLDDGWLSADLVPLTKDTVYIDATRPLPIPDASIDFILCEHMIEHISLRDARSLLVEFRRILRRNGVLRLATPNLDRLLQMMSATTLDEATQFYISDLNSMPAEIPGDDKDNPVYMLNRLMHDWGHQFLYNQRTLTTLLLDAGFTNVVECTPFVSTHPELTGVDRHHEEVGERTNEIESLLLEAQVPEETNQEQSVSP
jgi:predicted SAM-dependent methyltransferase